MLERLKNALAECENELLEIQNKDDELAIREEVCKAEIEIRNRFAEIKNAQITEKSYEIKALNRLIEKERIASEQNEMQI